MLEQERWGRDRFEPLVMLAQTAAGTADALFELISLVQKHSVLSWDVDGTILRDAWMRCYRRPVSLEAVIANLAVNPEIAPAEVQPSQYRRGKREGGKQFREWLERLLTGKLT